MTKAGALGAGGFALSLLGCGSESDSGGIEGDASGLLSKREDRTAQAKPGGTWPSTFAAELQSMDPIATNATPTLAQLIPVYNTMLKAGMSTERRPGDDAITGDAAASWEISGDGQRVVMKMRPNMKWDPRPPTNGRLMTTDDVKWSWDKYASVGNSAAEMVHSRNPDAAVESLEAPDASTVVFKLAFPYSGIINQLSLTINFNVMPRAEGFDFRSDMRGSGAYRLERYTPGVGVNYVRNPDYYDSPRPYFERMERVLLPEYATQLAQFKTGAIWNLDTLRPEDVLQTKRDHPELVLYANPRIPPQARFTVLSKRDDSVFKDVRLRRAISMMLDRNLLVETFQNVQQFRDAGLPMTIYWHGHLGAGQPEWLDPRGTALGEGAKYFQYNPEEARKLVQATGSQLPVAAPFGIWTDQDFDLVKENQVLAQMMSEGGVFKIDIDPLQYDTTWRTARQSAGMGFTGLLAHRAAEYSTDVTLTQKYTPRGRNSVSAAPIPGVTDLVLQQKVENDQQKRIAIVHQIQRNLAMEWPDISWAGEAPGFTLHWPWLQNVNTFIEGNPSAKAFTYAWYDESKRKTS